MNNAPRLGTTVYLDAHQTMPMIVVNRIGTTLYLVPERELRTTHQGNVYNERGQSQWRV